MWWGRRALLQPQVQARLPLLLGVVGVFLFLGLITAVTDRPYASNAELGLHPYKAIGTRSLRVLVGMTVGGSCMYRVDTLIKRWGTEHFHYMLFHFDKADWGDLAYNNRPTNAVKHYRYQFGLKMTHYKRHITPKVMQDYDYFFLIDCDTDLEHFDVDAYLKIVNRFNIPISQPAVARSSLLRRSSDHRTCRHVPGPHFGRWTSFVENGPVAVFSRTAWDCVYDLVQGDLGSGWGIDYKWCAYAADRCRLGYRERHERAGGNWGRVCAVIDAQQVYHLDERSASELFGARYQPRQDAYEFERRFPMIQSTRNANCMCACDDRDTVMTALRTVLLQVGLA
ncbi:uncharacterized protein MONBRDRAFT_7905 [Monosiga brevicollis MX1]|uniref:Hexosyltransferase n=1 Tax=Monosiga brevicollis TaxID=81824 RepID=A9UYF4_MONBE|nr:uncharacterized protein MONBRDRAFT_7905 [Monosiga brevicollis MX1]EDQ89453.1 predicted protein [Monosiga brevicollis MX1]|eukprot:XP_001745482.1 hypothetical protein [Monosiga brevicollis MX1]